MQVLGVVEQLKVAERCGSVSRCRYLELSSNNTRLNVVIQFSRCRYLELAWSCKATAEVEFS
jgi:hypothetical protein